MFQNGVYFWITQNGKPTKFEITLVISYFNYLESVNPIAIWEVFKMYKHLTDKIKLLITVGTIHKEKIEMYKLWKTP